MEYNYKTNAGTRCDLILFACRSKQIVSFCSIGTYDACPEKDFYTYIYYFFKSWITRNKQRLIDVEIIL